MASSFLSGSEALTASEQTALKEGAKRGRSSEFAQNVINEYLSMPKTRQREGIVVALVKFNTDGKTRTTKQVADAINRRAIATDAPVWAKPSAKRPETHVAMFYGEHTKTGPREKKNDGAAPQPQS